MSVATPTPADATIFWRVISRVVWLQVRSSRGLWCITAATMSLAQWSAPLGNYGSDYAPRVLDFVTLVAAMMYLLAAPAISFSQEHEGGTRARLLMLPAGWLSVVGAVLVSIVLQTIGLLALGYLNRLVVLRLFFDVRLGLAQDVLDQVVLLSGLALSVGMLAALLCRRTLLAILGSGAALICFLGAFAALQLTGRDFTMALVVIVPMLLTVSMILARGWFQSNSMWSLPNLFAPRSGSRIDCPRRLADLNERAVRSQQVREYRFLAWREGAASSILFLAILTALGLMFAMSRLSGSNLFNGELVPLVTLVCGLLVFRGEQFQNRIRFLSDRGVSPNVLWVSKHRVWLVRTALLGVLFALIGGVHPGRMSLVNLCVLSLTAYSIGQACSIWFRRALVAVGMTVVLSLLTSGWLLLLLEFRIPMVVSVLPLAVGCFAASWLYCGPWMDGHSGWKPFSPSLRLMTVAIVACYVSVGLYRVFEVPAVPETRTATLPAYSTLEEIASGPAQDNTAEYRTIARRLELWPLTFSRIDKAPIPWNKLDVGTRAWVGKFETEVDEIVRIIRRGGLFFDEHGERAVHLPRSIETDTPFPRLGVRSYSAGFYGERFLPLMLLEFRAAQLHAEGRFTESENLYQATIEGYWQTIRSDSPGRDLQTAFAGAGHVLRRMGELGCVMASLDEPITSMRFGQLLEDRPSLNQINRWAHEMEVHPGQFAPIDSTAMFKSIPNEASAGRRWLLSEVWKWDSQPERDFFTFGVRRKRTAEWFHWHRAEAIKTSRSTEGAVSSLLLQQRAVWAAEQAQQNWAWDTAEFDNNPINWVHAEIDLKTDAAAAIQLIDFATQLRREPDKVAAAQRYEPTVIDYWTGESPLQWFPDGVGRDIHLPNHQTIVADHPVFLSIGAARPVGSSGRRNREPRAGGPRYYPIPHSVIKEWQLRPEWPTERVQTRESIP